MSPTDPCERPPNRPGLLVAAVALSCLLALRLARERRAYRAGRIAAVRSRMEADRGRR